MLIFKTHERSHSKSLLLPIFRVFAVFRVFYWAVFFRRDFLSWSVMIELNNSKPRISPATVYGELSHLATNYRLDCFDVYGDYDKDNESSILRSFEGAVALLFGKDDVRAINCNCNRFK